MRDRSRKGSMQGRRRGLLLLLSAVVGLTAISGACEPPPAGIKIRLYYPYGVSGQNLFKRVKRMSLSVKGGILKDSSGDGLEFDTESKEQQISALECAEGAGRSDLEIQLLAFDGGTTPFASGRQVLHLQCGMEREVHVFLSTNDAFSSLGKLGPDGTEESKMGAIRVGHAAAFLPDGRILITGGANMSQPGKYEAILSNTEIFDPETNTFTSGPTMSSPRAFHTLTRAGDRVYAVGGLQLQGGKPVSISTVDVFELQGDGTLSVSQAPPLAEARAHHTTSRTPDLSGLFVYGGLVVKADGTQSMAKKWEMLSASSAKKMAVGSLADQGLKALHTATRLGNGILLTGGVNLNGGKAQALKSCFLVSFDTSGAKITSVEDLAEARAGHTATVLVDGRVVLVGGMIPSPDQLLLPGTAVASIEIRHPNGQAPGGTATTSGKLQLARAFHTATLLESGSLLITGGLGGNWVMAGKAERLTVDQKTRAVVSTKQLTHRKDRFLHTATLLLNGHVLVLGGATVDAQGSTKGWATLFRGEIYNPGPMVR